MGVGLGSPGSGVCGGFQGPGDIASGAIVGVAIRAWSASTCGARFANITVSGVSADMLTSATTGALIPQTINGSVCPNADIHAGGFSDAAGFPVACGNVNMSVLNNTLHGATTTSGENNGFFGTGCGTVGASSQVQQLQGNLIFNISGIANNSNTGNGAFLGEGSTSFTCCATNSYIQFTLAHDIGANGTTCGGPVGLWVYQTYGALKQFNEVYNMKGSGGLPMNACDFAAFDDDINAIAGLSQYLYGHDTGGPGFAFFQAGIQSTLRYSIFENTASYNEDGGGAISVAAGGGTSFSGFSFQAYNNTIFQNYVPGTSSPPTCVSFGFGASYTGGGLFANNACRNEVVDTFNRTNMMNGNSATSVASITMKNNDYFTSAGGVLTTAINWPNPTNYTLLSDLQAGTGQETGSKIITTGFTAPPTGNCTWTPSTQSTWPPSGCPSAYSTLAAGLKSAGANLASTDPVWFVAPQPTDAGTRDYYANTIPGSGSCYNMGAYGVCP